MKIAIAMDQKQINAEIGQSFGRCSTFLIYDTDKKVKKYIDNTAKDASGGAGIKASQLLVDEKIDMLIALRLGQNAADVLNAAKIKILKGIDGISAAENINTALKGNLPELNEIHPGFHGKN